MAILAYLVRKKESEEGLSTANEISNKAPEFIKHGQKHSRVMKQLKFLEIRGFVRGEKAEVGIMWEITESGKEHYKKMSDLMRSMFYS